MTCHTNTSTKSRKIDPKKHAKNFPQSVDKECRQKVANINQGNCNGLCVNIKSKIFKTKNCRLIMQSKCAKCRFKNSRFVKEQEAKTLFSNLGIETLLSKIPLLNVVLNAIPLSL